MKRLMSSSALVADMPQQKINAIPRFTARFIIISPVYVAHISTPRPFWDKSRRRIHDFCNARKPSRGRLHRLRLTTAARRLCRPHSGFEKVDEFRAPFYRVQDVVAEPQP